MKGLVLCCRNDLECLKYAHENGCPWDKKTCSEAALNGHLECLQYAHENGVLGTKILVTLLREMTSSV